MSSISQKRTPIPTPLRTEIFERDDYSCQKCGLQQDIAIHHKLAVFDGGLNAPENLICLCGLCHQEWHMFFEGLSLMTFTHWLDVPPARALVLAWVMAPENMSLQEWQIGIVQEWRRQARVFNELHPPKRRKRR